MNEQNPDNPETPENPLLDSEPHSQDKTPAPEAAEWLKNPTQHRRRVFDPIGCIERMAMELRVFTDEERDYIDGRRGFNEEEDEPPKEVLD